MKVLIPSVGEAGASAGTVVEKQAVETTVREGELRIWMKQETINSTNERQAEYLPLLREAGGGWVLHPFFGRTQLLSVLDRGLRESYNTRYSQQDDFDPQA
jgi:hypothetical protein